MIRLVTQADAPRFVDYYQRNAHHLKTWEPQREANYHNLKSWQQRLEAWCSGQEQGLEAHFIWLEQDNMLGLANLSGVIHGPFKACYLGYSVDGQSQGKGIGKQLVEYSCTHAFEVLKLNRVMANYMPRNTRSERLLASVGFKREGTALKYLKIDGRWQDHILSALLNPNSD
ncbi:GNAT family N-acetyltransferase [Alginatibacterium sediminis]|uniref:GNAT family N-acetyltransferase n=1 Tax=Alginatibacterium sediminis TaxID=2164068 RepID=UPI0013143B68|nr:GNAT family N-acetyltransferase [Alginatibacterium sediminis]